MPTDNSSAPKTTSTAPIKGVPTSGPRTTVDKTPVPRKVVLTPPELKISDTAEYVTSRGHELRLDRDSNGLWYCYFYKGGQLPDVLDGKYGTKSQLHTAIVQYLSADNVLGTARWPVA